MYRKAGRATREEQCAKPAPTAASLAIPSLPKGCAVAFSLGSSPVSTSATDPESSPTAARLRKGATTSAAGAPESTSERSTSCDGEATAQSQHVGPDGTYTANHVTLTGAESRSVDGC